MSDHTILDDFEVDNPSLIKETPAYRMVLTALWLIFGAWCLYEGTKLLEFMLVNSFDSGFISHYRGTIYENYLIGLLSLGMAAIIFKKSENRVFYLFSLAGIVLILPLDKYTEECGMIIFLPAVMLLFMTNLRAYLICYGVGLLLLILGISMSGELPKELPFILILHFLVLMGIFSYRKGTFGYQSTLSPFKEVRIKLKYRLFLLVGFIPLILSSF